MTNKPTKATFGDNLKKQINKVEEVSIEPQVTVGSFSIQPKEPKPKSNAKNNFPIYMEKEGADLLLKIARENGLNRNDLIIQMINTALTSLGEKHVK